MCTIAITSGMTGRRRRTCIEAAEDFDRAEHHNGLELGALINVNGSLSRRRPALFCLFEMSKY